MRRRLPSGWSCLVLIAAAACARASDDQPEKVEARYVGRDACARCHAEQVALHRGSDHDRAMAVATERSVLGDFDRARFEDAGRTVRFDRSDDTYWIEVEDDDGSIQGLQVLYTFGVDPLQQYLVAVEGGRLQRVPYSWDTRSPTAGGGRWFHVYGDVPIGPGDLLHWTRRSQTWNYQCADCHSTGLAKRYDPTADRYETSWAEIAVSCEACHGPGSVHIEWAESGGTPATGNGLRRADPLETCAACHAHRTPIAPPESGGGFLDRFRPSLLRAPLYHPDGQVREETFVYGSFLQSRMHREGVTCIDCHDAHSGGLVARGNDLCVKCHGSSVYDRSTHTFHLEGSPASACVACHMPSTTFMQVDERRDHSFRTPWPAIETAPNACLSCHEARTPEWVTAMLQAWYGMPQDRIAEAPFGPVFRAAEDGDPRVLEDLVLIARDPRRPAIVRATALSLMDRYVHPGLAKVARAAAADPSPLVRAEAARPLTYLAPGDRLPVLRPLLADTVRLVRIAAARALAGLDNRAESSRESALAAGWAEYEASLEFRSDDPVAIVERGDYLLARGRIASAEESYRRAIRLEDRFVPAYVNLADLLRGQAREGEALRVLQAGIARVPDEPSLHHSLGLLLVRTSDLAAASLSLRRANQLDPRDSAIGLAYALTLDARGRTAAAVEIVDTILKAGSFDRNLLLAAVDLHRKRGDHSGALDHASRLAALYPEVRSFHELVAGLQSALDGKRETGSGS